MMDAEMQRAAALLLRATLAVVCTGAGASQESGIPTFRDGDDSLWGAHSALELATPTGFQANPALVWNWYQQQRRALRAVTPNAGHRAIAALENELPQVIVLTQNIDGLHQQAGSTDVVELHGNIERAKCSADCRGIPTIIPIPLEEAADMAPPRCPHCGALVRPDVVWFGEALNRDDYLRAERLCQRADVIVLVGTSGTIPPASLLPQVAARRRIPIIEVNPHETLHTDLATVSLRGTAATILPHLVAHLHDQRLAMFPASSSPQ